MLGLFVSAGFFVSRTNTFLPRPSLDHCFGALCFDRCVACSRSVSLFLWSGSGNEEEEEEEIAYGNRSLSWTQRYRNLFPYESARKSVIELGLRSKFEWDEYIENGKEFHGPYLPNHPDEMYRDDWESWDEWLGIMRDYDDCRRMVRFLQLEGFQDYKEFVRTNRNRAEGLRIPAQPDLYYKDKGWVSFEHFFGAG